jgi:hypothetical protein
MSEGKLMRLWRWSRPLVGIAFVGVLGLGLGERVAAQDATPAVGGAVISCVTEPRSIDEMLAVWFGPDGSPIATPQPQESFATAADIPQGTPADEETAAALTATMQEVFACFDEGNFPSAFALMTDHALSQFGPDVLSPEQDTPEEVRALLEAQIAAAATPGANEGMTMTVVSDASEARTFDDGRAGAIFESEGDTVFAYFVQEGDTWLLDDFIDILDDATPTAG